MSSHRSHKSKPSESQDVSQSHKDSTSTSKPAKDHQSHHHTSGKHKNGLIHSEVRHDISSVRSQNLRTLIFTKTTFCQHRKTKCMGHILSNSRSSRPIRTPLKSINNASNMVSMKNSIILVLILQSYEVLP